MPDLSRVRRRPPSVSRRERARALVVGTAPLLILGACKGDGLRGNDAAAAAPTQAELAPDRQAPAAPTPLPSTCLLAGTDAVEREAVFTDVVLTYFARTEECSTRLLTAAMDSERRLGWANYLVNYTHALFGCGLWFSPLPGGVDAFGLAHTEAVGIPNPALGTGDAALLIDLFMNSCAEWLALPSADASALRMHLERAARTRIDASSSARLSDCP